MKGIANPSINQKEANPSPFLQVTTYEKKNGFLLIEVFRRLFNSQKYGHQGSILGGLSYNSRFMESFIYADIDPENLLTQLDTLSTMNRC